MLTILTMTSVAGMDGSEPECRKMKDIYAGGREICENMWDGAFKYEEDEDNSYTMWFFDSKNNPNDAITARLKGQNKIQGEFNLPVDQCFLEYYHKGDGHEVDNSQHPTEEPETFQECHPWADRSCCHQDTVSSVKKIRESYGPEYHWDRCGPMSQACERFFVMEACFYECEPNAGVYRKHKGSADHPDPFAGSQQLHDDTSEETNSWQLHQMPIKASFCNAWYQACKEDYFCGADNGSYFSCAKQWEPFDVVTHLPGSCHNSCNQKSKTGPCMCDDECEKADPMTCCKDREDFCKPKWVKQPFGTCEGHCGAKSSTPDNADCYCDALCANSNDCCLDKADHCSAASNGSCQDSCGKQSKTGSCYCDESCEKQGDCCTDKMTVCTSDPSAPCSATGDC